MKDPIGFIGLGNMGLGMARNLQKAGFPLVVYDVKPEPLQEVRKAGAVLAVSPREVARKARISILVVLNFPQIEEVVFGKEGMSEGLKPGDILIASSTIAPAQIQSLGKKLEPVGVKVLDAPISGGKEGAQAGTLSIMVGGEKEGFEKCRKVFEAMGKNIYHLGPLGSGLILKLVNNLLVAVNNLAVAEAVTLGTQAGLDPQKILEVIPKSAGDSWMFRNRAYRMVNRDFACRGELDILVKDMGYVLDMAKSLKIPVLLTALAKEVYQMASCQGHGKEDDSAIVKAVETMGGIQS